MKWVSARGLAVCVVLVISCAASLSLRAAEGDDWRPLFDGRSLTGWQHVGPGAFKIENGALVTQGGMGLLWYTREQFSNCQVRVVFKPTGSNDNSGVFIRMPARPVNASDGVDHGYEVQIANNADPFHRTGCLYSVARARSIVSANIGDWNTMIITLFGPRTRVHVNGVMVTDHLEENRVPDKSQWQDPERARRPDAGYIGLQNNDKNSVVHFREISVRPLADTRPQRSGR